jgi:hypothetical protein
LQKKKGSRRKKRKTISVGQRGCRYCVIIHHRRRCGKTRGRGTAMCLAQGAMRRCATPVAERGPGCAFHDRKVAMATEAGAPSVKAESEMPAEIAAELARRVFFSRRSVGAHGADR